MGVCRVKGKSPPAGAAPDPAIRQAAIADGVIKRSGDKGSSDRNLRSKL